MKKITLTFPGNSTLEIDNEIRPVTILNRFESNGKKIIAVRVNNEICPLDGIVNVSAYIEPV